MSPLPQKLSELQDFVSQVKSKSQIGQFFKSQNLIQSLRFRPNFLHVTSIFIEV